MGPPPPPQPRLTSTCSAPPAPPSTAGRGGAAGPLPAGSTGSPAGLQHSQSTQGQGCLGMPACRLAVQKMSAASEGLWTSPCHELQTLPFFPACLRQLNERPDLLIYLRHPAANPTLVPLACSPPAHPRTRPIRLRQLHPQHRADAALDKARQARQQRAGDALGGVALVPLALHPSRGQVQRASQAVAGMRRRVGCLKGQGARAAQPHSNLQLWPLICQPPHRPPRLTLRSM